MVHLHLLLLLSAFFALGVTTAPSVAAPAFTERAVATAIAQAGSLSARIRSYHRGPGRWTGSTPPPADYCATMRAGEVVVKELARLESRAILYRQPGLALRLQQAGNALGDELDDEEEINQQAGIPYTIYPCPPLSPFPARAYVLRVIEQRMPACRRQADALGLSFAARRSLMQQCLRLPGT